MPVNILALTLALAPAVVAWVTGRAVLARVDDPVLPELLWERRRRLAGFSLAGALAVIVLFVDDALWALPLLWIALLLSSYPLRRALFGERWSALAFLRYAIFSAIGSVGLWLLAAFAPALVTSLALGVAPNNTDTAVRIALTSGFAFGMVILTWQRQYVRVFLALHRAVPLRSVVRPELMARLDAILDRAAPALTRRPETYRYGAAGGYVMNAYAIPSLSDPAVALGTTLVATMTDDEIVAVFAHEVAHHEQFGPRLRRARAAGLLLAALTAALPAFLVGLFPAAAMPVAWCIPVLVAITLGKRAASRRDAETASDVRAVVLTGDPTSLVNALTKLHVYSRVPRRWPHAVEQAATHPSLARRIQAIRERIVGDERLEAQPPVAAAMTAVRSTISGVVVALDRDRAYWFDGVPSETPLRLDALRDAASSYRAIAYGDLTDLTIGVAKGGRSIEATDRNGRRWSSAIQPNDVAAVQTALDRIDVKLGRRRPAVAPAGANAVRWLALALLVTLLMGGELGIALIPIIFVLVRPTLVAAVAATAAITIARLGAVGRLIVWADPVRQLALLAALAVAVILIAHTVRRVRMDASRGDAGRFGREAWWLVGVLSGIAALMGVALWPLVIERPVAAVGHPLAISIATVLFGVGAAFLTVPQRWWRAAGSLTSALALGGGIFLSGDGWLVRRLPALGWSTARIRPAGSVRVPGGALSLQASLNGSAFAVTQYRSTRRGDEGAPHFLIGRVADSLAAPRSSDATKILFLDDETLLALDTRGTDSVELRAERVAADANGNVAVLWRQRLPAMDEPQLLFDRTRRAWIVVGRGDSDFGFIVSTDTLGGSRPRTYRHSDGPSIGEIMTQPLAAFADGGAVWSTLAHLRSSARGAGGVLMPMLLAMTASPRWELRGTDAAGERFLAEVEGFPTCATEIDAAGTLCVEHSPDVSRVWRATSAKTVARVADLPPSLDIVHAEGSDRVAAAERFGSRVVILDATSRQAFRLTLPGENAHRAGARWTGDVVARGSNLLVLTVGRDGATVNRYRIQ